VSTHRDPSQFVNLGMVIDCHFNFRGKSVRYLG